MTTVRWRQTEANGGTKCKTERKNKSEVRELGLRLRWWTGVMWIDWGFAECGQTWLVLLNRSVFAALEPPKDEKIKREKREKAPSKRWKPLRSLAQTDRVGNGEAHEGKDDGKEEKIKRNLWLAFCLWKPNSQSLSCPICAVLELMDWKSGVENKKIDCVLL